ncbi:MAG: transcription antitermination factor NusB [Eggerthellaceae bacterium]|nr:transcription antitermination factor NusB [Eggerthellaceae bacterium]
MSKRHERISGRRSAVQVLYTSEIQGRPASELLDEGCCLSEDGPLPEYAVTLARGVEERCADIDACLEATSENWAVARMPIVDRSILRLAAYEMIYVADVPVSVAINEAVELAKEFGGEDESPRFVNGVLGRIAKSLEAGELAVEGAVAKEAAADAPRPGAVAAAVDALAAQLAAEDAAAAEGAAEPEAADAEAGE